ncbi:MAG: VCBS repeat-containing protein, partial [Chitinophagia bacterium]|nr:VCBS repeat-containing protein [Chitinophagia bacterium]
MNALSSPLSASAAFPTGTFSNFVNYSTGTGNTGPISLITADFNNDGRPDLACTNLAGGTISVWRNTTSGSLSFASPITVTVPSPYGPFQLANGDFDGDGKQDIAVVGHQLSVTPVFHGLILFKNNSTTGSIGFGSSVNYTTGLDQPRTLSVGDLDGDTKLDIAVANNAGNNVTMFKNVGTGSLSTSTFSTFTGFNVGPQPVGIQIGDIDGDTKPEILVANSDASASHVDSTLSILRNHPRTFVDTISGNTQVCITSHSDTLHDATPGGRWLSLNPFVASIDPVTGVVVPVSVGTVTMVYTASCGGDTASVSKVISIITTPSVSAITGSSTLCTGLTFTLADATPGGVWGSLSPTIASIDATTGEATGLRTGTATITYGVSNTCGTRVVSFPVTVALSPSPITGSTFTVCSGSSITLSSSTTGGSWFATAGTGSAAASAGVVTGGAPGTAIVTYRLSSGCYDTAEVTVNPLPGGISGSSRVCLGNTITLSTTSSTGAWLSSSPSVATVDSTTGDVYSVGAGSVTISYIFRSTGCSVSFPITVNRLPSAISGVRPVCAGSSITLTDATSGGSWSSDATGVAAIGTVVGTSVVINAGTSGTATISYTVSSTGCFDTAIITVNPVPAAITGPTQVCVGDSISLSSGTALGTWSSSTSRSTVSGTGGVTGVSAGATTISYTLPGTGCYATRSVTVNALPTAIAGLHPLCPGFNITATSTPVGGSWTHTNPTALLLGGTTGLLSGRAAGLDTLTYTTTAGCKISDTIRVNPAPPAIDGPDSVCARSLIFLSDSESGGVWHSNDPSIAFIDSVTGVVVGRAGGLTIITYTTPTYGCSSFLSMRVSRPAALPESKPVVPPSSNAVG